MLHPIPFVEKSDIITKFWLTSRSIIDAETLQKSSLIFPATPATEEEKATVKSKQRNQVINNQGTREGAPTVGGKIELY